MISHVKTAAAVAVFCCSLCTALAGQVRAQPAPHDAHQGRHGGAFAAAAADTLHVEAVWSEQRRLRLLITDASGDPLTIETLRGIEAIVVAGDSEAFASLIETEHHFEARIPTLRLPAVIDVRFKASAAAPEERLVFNFDDYSKPIDAVPREAPAEIPDTLAGILRVLDEDRRAAEAIAAEKDDTSRLLPIEERIRERALAIDPYLKALSTAQRLHAEATVTLVVRTCWQLHIVLDNGTSAQLDATVAQLGEALDRVRAAVEGLVR